MKWIDIISQAFSNLMRRKLRSGLTMLGVVIGTAAIIVTISLGYGAEKTQMEALENMSDLRMISVSPRYGSANSTTNRRISKITDGVISQMRAVAGVDAVSPIMYFSLGPESYLMSGKYENYATVLGVFPRDFAKMQKLKGGRYFSSNTSQMEFIMSELSMMEFVIPGDESTYINYWEYIDSDEPLPLPKIDWLKGKFTMQLRWDEEDDSTDVDADARELTKDFSAKMVGFIDATASSMFTYGTVVNLEWVKRYYRENRNFLKDFGITKSNIDEYSNVYVLADSVNNVTRIMRELDEMGLQCSSQMAQIEQMRSQIRTMQGFLGFIGMISMLVAALSIANTMMMSIYERTREIGVMKVLGCKLNNIRFMFLSEAAFIGLIGGAMGLVVSYSLSYALNNVEALRNVLSSVMSSTQIMSTGEGAQLSIIPTELALFTWLGVASVSILSGVHPAQRAMNLSSLAAIRAAD